MSLSIEMYDIKKIEWPDILETVILETYSSDHTRTVCLRAYLELWAVGVMVTQKFKEAQSRSTLKQKTPLTMSNTYHTDTIVNKMKIL